MPPALPNLCFTHLPAPALTLSLPPARSCTAYPLEVCDPVQQQEQKFILAFTASAEKP